MTSWLPWTIAYPNPEAHSQYPCRAKARRLASGVTGWGQGEGRSHPSLRWPPPRGAAATWGGSSSGATGWVPAVLSPGAAPPDDGEGSRGRLRVRDQQRGATTPLPAGPARCSPPLASSGHQVQTRVQRRGGRAEDRWYGLAHMTGNVFGKQVVPSGKERAYPAD